MEKDIARAIGYFYYEKENQNEDNAIKAINDIQIQNIEYNDGTLCITLGRPGIFIGKRGENIMAITNYLRKEFDSFKEIKLREDSVICHLYDFDMRYMDDDF